MINRILYYILFTIITTSSGNCFNDNLNEFLMDKFVHVNNELSNEVLNQAMQTIDVENVEIYDSNTTILSKNYANMHIFTLFEATYILMDTDLYKVTPSDDTVTLEPSAIFFKVEDKLSFVKTTEYNDMGIVLLCYQNGISNLYTFVNNTDEIKLQQSIQSDVEIRDATFFTAKTSLYLFITSGQESNLKPSVLYKWLGTHFDEIDQILLISASKITTFPTTSSEMIIVLQNSAKKAASTMFEFNETLKKTQLLTTKTPPQHILTYIYKNTRYVVVFDKDFAFIHFWDGSQLINTGKLKSPRFEKTSVAYTNKFPVILATTKEELMIYTPVEGGLTLSTKSKYDEPFKTINDFSIIQHNNKSIAVIVGLAMNNTSYTFLYFSLHLTTRDNYVETDTVSQCLNKLENKLISTQPAFQILQGKSENMLQLNEGTDFDGKVTLSSPLVSQVSNIDTVFPTTRYLQDKLRLEDTINRTNQKIHELLPKLENVFLYNDEVLNGNLIINGDLRATNLKARSVNVELLNSKRWTPEQWLSYSLPQTITGFAKINKLVTNELLVPKEGTIFNDLLLANGNQRINGSVTFKSLEASKFFTPAINDIPRENIYLRSNPNVIKGIKEFPNMNVKNLEMDYLNDQNASIVIKLFADPKSHKYTFEPTVKIEDLRVETINGVHWDAFKNSAFLVGKTDKISGTLSMVGAKVDTLFTEFVNGINVSDLLTTTSNQIITSNINFNNINAPNLNCDKINDVRIPGDVVLINSNTNIVKGPVTIDNMHILGDLNVNGVDKSNLKLNDNHIIGTNENDLQQIYNSKVKIVGNVHFENVLPSGAVLILNGSEFTLNELNDYWSKNTRQTIPVHVEMQKGITTPHLKTKFLNGIEISNYMLDDLGDKQPTKFHFESVTVFGNVTLNHSEKHYPNFDKIEEESVKYNGNYTISGEKRFKGKLIVDNLSVNYLNEIAVDEAATINSEEFLGSFFFENLIIKGNLSTKSATVNIINEENLNELYNNTILIDRPAHFENLQFENVIAKNLYTNEINNKSFNEYVFSVEKMHVLDTLERVTFGNVSIKNVHNLSYINNVDTEVISKQISRAPLMEGKVTFTDPVFVKSLYVFIINGINMKELLHKLFYRNWDQNIPGKQLFNIVRTSNLLAPVINDKNIENLINIEDTKPQKLILKDVLHLQSTKFLRSVHASNTTCDMRTVARNLQSPPTRFWETITFLKNVFLNGGNLNYILENAVTTDKNNTITAPVTFQQVSTKTATTVKNINNVDIQGIYDDALLKYENDQFVTGHKIMTYMTAAGATVSGNANIPIINGIKILDVNKTIVHKNHINNIVIKGHKHFAGGLEANVLNSRLISGVQPENLISLSNLKIIPHATFDSLHILHNFDANFINGFNFSSFLTNRLLKNHPTEQILYGKYYFDNIKIYGDAIIPKINEIDLNDVVFDVGVQKIPTEKTFQQHVVVYHNIDVDKLNGINISDAFDKSILLNRDETIDGNIKLSRVTHIGKNISAENINGVPVHYINQLLMSQNPKAKANIVFNTIDKIENILKRNWHLIDDLPQKYMYLEKSTEFQINLPNTISAQIVESKGHVMIHVIGEAPGLTCGLPNSCNCPTQVTLQITPEYSTNTFAKLGTQRVYSYENDLVTVHVITYSVSSSFICRTNSTLLHEFTTITWTIASGEFAGKSSVYASNILGYVTGVEFFRLNGDVFVIISVFYDPVKNTHNLNNLVFRLNPEKNEMELIQEIQTKGSWTLRLFHTAQGINLIIGNIFDSEHIYSSTNTDIYRFNAAAQIFELLRSVPGTGCISATGVVLGLDSLIVLALNGAPTPMLVLKYNHYYDNYYLYQSFGLDSSVLDVSVFYIGGPGISDVYLCAVTESGGFYIYTFRNIQGWKLESQGELDGLRALVPFTLNKKTYLFAPSTKMSSLLTVVKNGNN